ncbi:uncharacterized protein [Rutidosis leptorrhynchoides]|uniref:uncharacterized protein n=1 Tax=Rutidosis leptorrhynchoides TaxID=125765 RepID=UPI003A996FA2
MTIISLNVRGLGKVGEAKFNWVKNLIRANDPDIFAIQESKRKKVNDKIIEILWGNSNFEYVFKPAIGLSGGTILIWNPLKFDVSQAVEKDFFLVIKGKWEGKTSETIVINVYGPHNDNLKQKFWESLENIMQVDIEDWIICGDFNEVRKDSERQNCVFIENRAKMFNEFIDRSHLYEIPLGGMKFTRISDDGLKYSKLDRFLVSEACMTTWVGISACTLDRGHSDHCPIILKDSNFDFGPRPVRIFDSWFENVECDDLIRNAWDLNTRNTRADCIFRDKLKKVKEVLKEKCNPKFNKLNEEIESLQENVVKWEKLVGTRDLSESEIHLWMESRKKWLEKDKEKAEMLKQKARIKWATEGDENSKYFHSCTKRRQNKNNILEINTNGLWIENPQHIKEEAFKHFSNRFKKDDSRRFQFCGPLEKTLSNAEASMLEAPYSMTEIY